MSGESKRFRALTLDGKGIEGTFMGAVLADGTARLWDLRQKDPAAKPAVLRGSDGAVSSVAISADNHWVMTGSYDGTARLLDLRAKHPAADAVILQGSRGRFVDAVAMSPDSHWVVTFRDKTARLWLLQVNDLIDRAA
jgi:WD40 repeat protein